MVHDRSSRFVVVVVGVDSRYPEVSVAAVA